MSQGIDRREIVEAVLGTEKAEGGIDVEGIVRDRVHKNRRYIRDPSEAPEGANVQQGPQGGYYIEDSGSSGGSSNDGDDADEVLGAGDKEMYSIAEESVTGLAPEEFDNEQGAMVDHVHDDMMDTIETEMDVDFDSLDDERYDQVTTTIQEYAEEVVGDEF